MTRRWSVPIISALGALVAVAVLATGLSPASGAIPDPGDGRYHACFVKRTGVVRVINYPKVSSCPKGQKLIDWGRTGPQGPQGVQGIQGLQGPQGLPGAAGITKIGLTIVQATGALVANDAFGSATVTCPAGKVVGGGHAMSGSPVNIVFHTSRPLSVNQWHVGAWNASGSNLSITAYAICMTTDPGTVIARKKGGFRPAGELIDPSTGKRKR